MVKHRKFNVETHEEGWPRDPPGAVSAETAKLAAEVDQGNIDLDGDPFTHDEEDEVLIEDE